MQKKSSINTVNNITLNKKRAPWEQESVEIRHETTVKYYLELINYET